MRYRRKQEGQVVAWVEGPAYAAEREIRHYAVVYGQDGPVTIEKHHDGRWSELK